MDSQDASIVVREIRKYISSGLLESADQLATLYLSSLMSKNGGKEEFSTVENAFSREVSAAKQGVIADILEIIGDIAFERKEMRRALSYYRQSFQYRKTNTNQLIGGSFSPTAAVRSQVTIVVKEGDAKLKFKEAKCLSSLKETEAAIKELESIPNKYRDFSTTLLLAQLYQESNLKKHSVAAYKEALLLSPLAMEVVQQLIQAGCDLQELLDIINEAMKQQPELVPLLTREKWLQTLISALIQRKNFDTEKSYTNLLAINLLFPRNPWIMSLIAMNAMDAEQIENAKAAFRKIFTMDPTVIEFMDIYAKLLFVRKEEMELNRLANEVIDHHPIQPQGYLIASWYCFLKGNFDHAASFVEKALILNPKYSETFKVRGRQLYYQKQFESALIAYSQANAILKDLPSFVGMIECNLALGKFKDAANTAREMVILFQKAAEVYYVMGTVLSKSPQGAAESIRAYGKALRIQPRMKKAAIALSMTLLELKRPEEALECLQNTLSKVSDPRLRLLLGKTFSQLGKYHEALEQLQICISLQPSKTDAEATQEIERIENILKGENSVMYSEEAAEVEEEANSAVEKDVEEEEEGEAEMIIGNTSVSYIPQTEGFNNSGMPVRRRLSSGASRILPTGSASWGPSPVNDDQDDEEGLRDDVSSPLMNEFIARGNNLFSRSLGGNDEVMGDSPSPMGGSGSLLFED